MKKVYGGNPYDTKWINELIRDLKQWPSELEKKGKALCQRLAEIGVETAVSGYDSRVLYDGEKDVSVSIEGRGESTVAVVAVGESVLFLEFGSGARYGYGHPEAGKHGMGPGTWSKGPQGKGHWKDPNGWYLPKEKGGGHSYGNEPAMAMYLARMEMERRIADIAREVFNVD